MKCPLCHQEMEEGGLIIDGTRPAWVPIEEFEKKGLSRLLYTGCRTIGQTNFILSQTRVPNAHFCRNCNKIVGIFDITNDID